MLIPPFNGRSGMWTCISCMGFIMDCKANSTETIAIPNVCDCTRKQIEIDLPLLWSFHLSTEPR